MFTQKIKSLVLIILLTCASFFSYAQHETKPDTKKSNRILMPPHQELPEFRIRCKTIEMVLSVKTLAFLHSNNSEDNPLMDKQSVYNRLSYEKTFLHLHTGLSWEIGNPPQQPDNLPLKLLSKKGKNSQEVIDWLNYVDFCNASQEIDDLAFEMIKNFEQQYKLFQNGELIGIVSVFVTRTSEEPFNIEDTVLELISNE